MPNDTGPLVEDQPVREVELHVCGRCGSVSKAAATYARGGKFFCTGPADHNHKQTLMTRRLFREVRR